MNLTLGLRKYINSFTSWEFPDDSGPQNPLSRIEHPFDQTLVAVGAGVACSGMEASVEWSGTLATLSNPKAQDSDWEDPSSPQQKTTFSEANTKPRCWIADLNLNTPLTWLSSLAPVAGYRINHFKFSYTDGYMSSIYNEGRHEYNRMPTPGVFIEFSQYYKQLCLGWVLLISVNFKM